MSDEAPRCVVCLDAFKDPRQAPCGHSFCNNCLLRLRKLPPWEQHCPICRKTLREGRAQRIDRDPREEIFAAFIQGLGGFPGQPELQPDRELVSQPRNFALQDSTAHIADLERRLKAEQRRAHPDREPVSQPRNFALQDSTAHIADLERRLKAEQRRAHPDREPVSQPRNFALQDSTAHIADLERRLKAEQRRAHPDREPVSQPRNFALQDSTAHIADLERRLKAEQRRAHDYAMQCEALTKRLEDAGLHAGPPTADGYRTTLAAEAIEELRSELEAKTNRCDVLVERLEDTTDQLCSLGGAFEKRKAQDKTRIEEANDKVRRLRSERIMVTRAGERIREAELRTWVALGVCSLTVTAAAFVVGERRRRVSFELASILNVLFFLVYYIIMLFVNRFLVQEHED